MPRGRPRKNPTDVLIKSAEFLGWALGGIEREILDTRQRLSALTAQAHQLRSRVGGKGAQPVPAAATPAEIAAPKRRRRKMSAEARKRMSEVMKKRWAERKRSSK